MGKGHELIVVMGVCGVGKSAVGSTLAKTLGVPFLEGDSYHPEKNVEKMRAGIPLDDVDREPWLRRMAEALKVHTDAGGVLACSALKRRYRETLRQGGHYHLVFLHGDRELIAERMRKRGDHYMPTSLLDSQLALLEPPDGDEQALSVDVTEQAQDIVSAIVDWIGRESKP